MNIRVDLNTPINDGTEVVFRSPVDCSQITGLIVYYNGESKEFAFADAHGNNVGDIDHLFAENAVVKVILDVSTSMAFVQNADTNAYLEGRFSALEAENKALIDKLCPSFTESGAIVTCEPVEGYPLEVEWETKNFARADETKDITSGDIVVTTTEGSAEFVVNGTPTANTAVAVFKFTIPPGTYIASVSGLIGTDYATCRDASGYLFTRCSATINPTFTTEKQADLVVAFVFSAGSAYSNTAVKFQIERGTTATAYEPYAETATKFTHTGKNVFGGSALVDELKSQGTGGVTVNEVEKTVTFNPGGMTRGIIFSKFKENTQYTIILYGHNTLGIDATNMAVKYTDGTNGHLIFEEVTENHYVIFKSDKAKTVSFVSTSWANGRTVLCYDQCGVFEGDISLEEFEAYTGKSFELGEHVPALAGVNTLWANTGDITVKGKADPVAIFNKLTNAVIATGGNV